MANASEVIRSVEAELGDSLSAIYFDQSGDFRLVAESSRPAKGRVKKQLRLAGQDGESAELIVDYVSSAKVARKVVRKALKDNKTGVAALFPNLQAFGYSEQRGTAFVELSGQAKPADESSRQTLEKSLKVPVKLTYEEAELRPTAGTMIGGRWSYGTSGGPLRPWCTTAFPARSPSGEVGMITSGHCSVMQYWRGTVNGQTVDTALNYRKFNDQWGDWGFFMGRPVDARFYADNSTSPRTVTGRRTWNETNARETRDNGTTLVVEGSVVCWFGQASGPTYGQQCGAVTSKHYSPGTCPAGSATICENNFILVEPQWGRPRFYITDGDSGGPVFAWNTAFGIITRARFYTDGTGSSMVYTHMDEPYYHGYSLCLNGAC